MLWCSPKSWGYMAENRAEEENDDEKDDGRVLFWLKPLNKIIYKRNMYKINILKNEKRLSFQQYARKKNNKQIKTMIKTRQIN